MNRLRRRWGLRARLVVAFVAVALLGTVITTVYSSVSLTSHLEDSARTRLHNSAAHFGDVAAVVSRDGRWDQQAIEQLHHLAQLEFLAVGVYGADGERVLYHPASGPVEAGAQVTAPVLAGDRQIGTVVVSRDDGRLFTAEEIQLREELLRMHVVSGVLSAAIAVLAALLLAVTLSRPLRSIRAGAEAMSAGDLDTRVPESGDDEMRSVAAALNRLAETLQQEEGLRKESVQDLAHELRTPVMGVLARVEAAQDGVLEDEAANLSAMHDEALRLARLLDDLSALAEAERPGLLLETEPVDLAAVAAAQAAAFAGAFADKGIELASDVAARRRRRRPPAARAGHGEPALERAALHGRRRVRAGDRRPGRRPRRTRGARHRHRHRARGRAARVHPVLARREVALPRDGRRRHRSLDRQGARAGARRRGDRGERARRGIRVPGQPAARPAGSLISRSP